MPGHVVRAAFAAAAACELLMPRVMIDDVRRALALCWVTHSSIVGLHSRASLADHSTPDSIEPAAC